MVTRSARLSDRRLMISGSYGWRLGTYQGDLYITIHLLIALHLISFNFLLNFFLAKKNTNKNGFQAYKRCPATTTSSLSFLFFFLGLA
jgi:hypothetical protein